MMSNRLNLILAQIYKPMRWNYRLCATVPQSPTDTDDYGQLFFDGYVQELLTTLTRIDYKKIFAHRLDGTSLPTPKYKFMTDKQLREAQANIALKAKERIQMPPVVNVRSDKIDVISNDPAIQGLAKWNYVFTDISYGKTNRNRLIVVREPNGILRHAYSRERHRMNQTYFPIEGRELHIPKMFEEPRFTELLENKKFVFILDRACLQFEPDDPEYHRITKAVYAHVNKVKAFEELRSTRHFGPLCFHLAWTNQIGKLLIELIQSQYISEAAALVRLYHKLNPTAKSATTAVQVEVELIRDYAEMDAPDRYNIIDALKLYQNLELEKEQIKMGILEAHGIAGGTDAESKT